MAPHTGTHLQRFDICNIRLQDMHVLPAQLREARRVAVALLRTSANTAFSGEALSWLTNSSFKTQSGRQNECAVAQYQEETHPDTARRASNDE